MLKKEMEEAIEIMSKKIDSLEVSAAVDRDMIKRAADKEGRHTKLRRHVDKALCAIEAIKQVNCGQEDHWREHGYQMIEQAKQSGEDAPEWPEPSKLYVALDHLQEVLSRPVEEPKQDSRFSQY